VPDGVGNVSNGRGFAIIHWAPRSTPMPCGLNRTVTQVLWPLASQNLPTLLNAIVIYLCNKAEEDRSALIEHRSRRELIASKRRAVHEYDYPNRARANLLRCEATRVKRPQSRPSALFLSRDLRPTRVSWRPRRAILAIDLTGSPSGAPAGVKATAWASGVDDGPTAPRSHDLIGKAGRAAASLVAISARRPRSRWRGSWRICRQSPPRADAA
jgi:hypothetical protein